MNFKKKIFSILAILFLVSKCFSAYVPLPNTTNLFAGDGNGGAVDSGLNQSSIVSTNYLSGGGWWELYTNKTALYEGKLYYFTNSTTAGLQECQNAQQAVLNAPSSINIHLQPNSTYTFESPVYFTNNVRISGGTMNSTWLLYDGPTNLYSYSYFTNIIFPMFRNDGIEDGTNYTKVGLINFYCNPYIAPQSNANRVVGWQPPYYDIYLDNFTVSVKTNLPCVIIAGGAFNAYIDRVNIGGEGMFRTNSLGSQIAFLEVTNAPLEIALALDVLYCFKIHESKVQGCADGWLSIGNANVKVDDCTASSISYWIKNGSPTKGNGFPTNSWIGVGPALYFGQVSNDAWVHTYATYSCKIDFWCEAGSMQDFTDYSPQGAFGGVAIADDHSWYGKADCEGGSSQWQGWIVKNVIQVSDGSFAIRQISANDITNGMNAGISDFFGQGLGVNASANYGPGAGNGWAFNQGVLDGPNLVNGWCSIGAGGGTGVNYFGDAYPIYGNGAYLYNVQGSAITGTLGNNTTGSAANATNLNGVAAGNYALKTDATNAASAVAATIPGSKVLLATNAPDGNVSASLNNVSNLVATLPLPAANLVGTVSAANLPAGVVTNGTVLTAISTNQFLVNYPANTNFNGTYTVAVRDNANQYFDFTNKTYHLAYNASVWGANIWALATDTNNIGSIVVYNAVFGNPTPIGLWLNASDNSAAGNFVSFVYLPQTNAPASLKLDYIFTNLVTTNAYVDPLRGSDTYGRIGYYPFQTINAAINSTSAPVDIYLAEGQYNENFILRKTQRLFGKGNASQISGILYVVDSNTVDSVKIIGSGYFEADASTGVYFNNVMADSSAVDLFQVQTARTNWTFVNCHFKCSGTLYNGNISGTENHFNEILEAYGSGVSGQNYASGYGGSVNLNTTGTVNIYGGSVVCTNLSLSSGGLFLNNSGWSNTTWNLYGVCFSHNLNSSNPAIYNSTTGKVNGTYFDNGTNFVLSGTFLTATNTLTVAATGATNNTGDTYLVSVTAGTSMALKDQNGNQYLTPIANSAFPLKPSQRFTGSGITATALIISK